ncbi:Kunitz/Bovine pancreatic trypsin inhibitor domain protein [Oesophagostomum dentatum]|uniref:Kunitz/Bovine pancreatic trypsin inhibitor domain protein n=1 Tax=Oesophagostomum dentatum TaxID=61180 RepID=A0A0B1T5K6_OESDE|nr:Kunitz/Bovine pancreatic trypsin inhibitor domain protein [Oesophagostomum dentatum]
MSFYREFTFSEMFFAAALFGLLTISSFTQALEVEHCNKEPDQGHTCDTRKPGIRYHYDRTTNKCLPFLYKGCGGNRNNYMAPFDCMSQCMAWDGPYGCVGKKNSTGLCDNKGLTCPEGSICKYGPTTTGVCCDKETEEQYNKELNPKCDGGKVLIKQKTSMGWLPLLGKKCSYEFCPEGADCVEGKWFAHCCGSEEKFGPKKA